MGVPTGLKWRCSKGSKNEPGFSAWREAEEARRRVEMDWLRNFMRGFGNATKSRYQEFYCEKVALVRVTRFYDFVD